MGTIPNSLNISDFKLISMFDKYKATSGKQVFPRLTLSRGLALKIEKTPKYWETGRIEHDNSIPGSMGDKIRQDFSKDEEFKQAALLTIQIYKDSSPSFINKRQPLGGGRSWKSIYPLY